MRRVPGLDGLRAVAILAVMAFHTSPAAHGGFAGVDVFFVVSGYLITAILLAEIDRTGTVNLRAFYLRRTLRLLPALVVMLLVTIPLMLTTLRDSLLVSPWAAVAACLFYVANWLNVAVNLSTGPLTHSWSLSIEEQYYLLWPALLLAVIARGRWAHLARALSIAVVVVVVSRAVLWGMTHGDWLFYATTSRADGLLIGTLLAVLLARREHRPLLGGRGSEIAAWTGIGGLVVLMAVMRPDGGFTFLFGLAAVSVCSVAIVHHLAVATEGPLVRLLTLRPLVAVGTVSYGLYLFHFPVFQAVQDAHPPRLIQHALELVLTVVLTVTSYVLVERPALRLKDRIAVRTRREPAVAAS